METVYNVTESDLHLNSTNTPAVGNFEEDRLVESGRQLTHIAIPVVAALGVCGNLVALATWTAESAYNGTTFLLKCLCVTDLVLLVGQLLNLLVNTFLTEPVLIWRVRAYMTVFFQYARIVSVHSTLAVTFSRWLAVHRPLGVRILLSRRRVVVGYCITLTWCFLVGVPSAYFTLCLFHVPNTCGSFAYHYPTFSAVQHTSEAVTLALPLILLLIFNVSLVMKVYRHRSAAPGLGQQALSRRSSEATRLVVAVTCLSVTTLLAFPLGVAVRIVTYQAAGLKGNTCDGACIRFLDNLSDLFVVFNSSANIVFYAAFVSHFRKLLLRRLQCCVRWPGVQSSIPSSNSATAT
ncbi:hypothetical protein BaRGS_00010624 [Batillaria attramentaria]|uniref:G-protein coupled receptors family 1 profile domain-containing protein n=1 Tax=Batillaria attramentaria TaxID=370345 RepID=A0ABD0LF90_9CAEN